MSLTSLRSYATWLLVPSKPMNDRHTLDMSQPRRCSTAKRPFWSLPDRSKPGLGLPVAKEKAVSRESDTRVTVGAASDAAISCMVAIPDSQVGNR